MPARSRRSSRALRGRRRQLVWATFSPGLLSFTTGATRSFDLLADLEVAGASKLGCTIMRTRGQMMFGYPASTAFWQWGLVVGRISDVGSNKPDPLTDNDVDWMLLRQQLPNESGATVDALEPFELDLRSKRKCAEAKQTYILSQIGRAHV